MDNRTLEEAKSYHETTKRRREGNSEAMPSLARASKVYLGAAATRLDEQLSMPDMNTLDALANTEFCEEIEIDLPRLSQVLRAAVDFVRRRQRECGVCPIEIYLVSTAVPGLVAGVYHLDSAAFALNRLREGDHRPDLVATAGDNQSLAAAPMTLILSARLAGSYRSILHDVGRALAHILATTAAARLAASAEMSFVDEQVNSLLGLDGRSEAALCLLPLGRSLDWAEHVGERVLPEVGVKTKTQDLDGAVDPAARKIHAASSLLSNEETRPLRGPCPRPRPEFTVDAPFEPSPWASRPLREVLEAEPNHTPPGKTLDVDALWAVLRHCTADFPADFLEGPETSLLDAYVVVHRVSGLEPGLYAFRPGTRGLKRLHAGELSADLEHSLAPASTDRAAPAHLIITSDLEPVLKRFGNRGYRLLHVEGGVITGRFGLAAESMGLRAAVLDFFDDDMSRLLNPHADGKEVILALGLG